MIFKKSWFWFLLIFVVVIFFSQNQNNKKEKTPVVFHVQQTEVDSLKKGDFIIAVVGKDTAQYMVIDHPTRKSIRVEIGPYANATMIYRKQILQIIKRDDERWKKCAEIHLNLPPL